MKGGTRYVIAKKIKATDSSESSVSPANIQQEKVDCHVCVNSFPYPSAVKSNEGRFLQKLLK